MIKVNNEKQDLILRHLKDFTVDMTQYLTSSREEVLLAKEVIQQFNSISNDYKRNLDSLIKTFSSKVEKTIFAVKSSGRIETKRIYNSLLRFSMNQILDSLTDFKEKFESSEIFNIEHFLKESSEYLTYDLAGLGGLARSLKDELGQSETQRQAMVVKKEEYFDFVHNMSLSKLYSFSAYKPKSDKNLMKLESLESAYLKQLVALNHRYDRVKSTFETARELFQSSIKKKFGIFTFDLFSSEKIKNDAKFSKFRETLDGYYLSYLDIPKNIWLANVSKLRDSFFPLYKLVSYSSKLEEISMKKLIANITSIQNEVLKEEIERANIIATVIILDLKVDLEDYNFQDHLVKINSDVLLLTLMKLKLFIKYEDQALIVSSNTLKLLKSLIEDGLSTLEGEDFSDAMMEILNLVFFLGPNIFLDTIASEISNDFTQMTEFSLLYHLRELPVFHIRNFWRQFYDLSYNHSINPQNTSKIRVINVVEKIMFLNFFLHPDLTYAQNFVESVFSDITVNFKVIRSSTVMKLSFDLHRVNRRKNDENFLFLKLDKIKKVFELVIKSGFITPSKLYLSKSIWKSVQGFALQKALSFPQLPLETRRKLWLKTCDGQSLPIKRNQDLTSDSLEQIKMDVGRTKFARGPEYHKMLMSVLVEFFERSTSRLEYFQGFNYITAFLLDVFDQREDVLQMLGHLSRGMIADFFSDRLNGRVNSLHFQLNHLIQEYYPALFMKWKSYDINSGVLFNSFIISLFTSHTLSNQNMLLEFWDIILVEKWQGVIKCIVYLIQLALEELLTCDSSDTFRFFSEANIERILLPRFSPPDFKNFVVGMKLDEALFKAIEQRFTMIRGTISMFEMK